jgi:hypothetical protein
MLWPWNLTWPMNGDRVHHCYRFRFKSIWVSSFLQSIKSFDHFHLLQFFGVGWAVLRNATNILITSAHPHKTARLSQGFRKIQYSGTSILPTKCERTSYEDLRAFISRREWYWHMEVCDHCNNWAGAKKKVNTLNIRKVTDIWPFMGCRLWSITNPCAETWSSLTVRITYDAHRRYFSWKEPWIYNPEAITEWMCQKYHACIEQATWSRSLLIVAFLLMRVTISDSK